MKKLLLAALVCVLLPISAEAGFVLRQKADGSACFVNTTDYRETFCLQRDNKIVKQSPTAGLGLEANIDRWCGNSFLPNISTSSTTYLVSPITGVLSNVWLTLASETELGTATISVQSGGVDAGSVEIASTDTIGTTFSITSNNEIFQTQAIRVASDGNSNNTVRLDITACVQPQ